MARTDIQKKVEELAAPIIKEAGCELVDIEYIKEGPNWYLRVYVDKNGGVTVDDCQRISEILSELLDRVDPIDHSYVLEVSSPGVDRPLKTQRDYEHFTGREIDVKLYSPMNGKKKYSGILIGLRDGIVTLDTSMGKLHFNKEKIASARLTFKF